MDHAPGELTPPGAADLERGMDGSAPVSPGMTTSLGTRLDGEWTFWEDAWCAQDDAAVGGVVHQLQRVGTFETIRAFWGYFNNLPLSKVVPGSSLHLMRAGVEPTSEDPAHEDGGRFRVSCSTSGTGCKIWLDLCLAVLGSQFPKGCAMQVTGISYTLRRANTHHASVWLGSEEHKDVVHAYLMKLVPSLPVLWTSHANCISRSVRAVTREDDARRKRSNSAPTMTLLDQAALDLSDMKLRAMSLRARAAPRGASSGSHSPPVPAAAVDKAAKPPPVSVLKAAGATGGARMLEKRVNITVTEPDGGAPRPVKSQSAEARRRARQVGHRRRHTDGQAEEFIPSEPLLPVNGLGTAEASVVMDGYMKSPEIVPLNPKPSAVATPPNGDGESFKDARADPPVESPPAHLPAPEASLFALEYPVPPAAVPRSQQSSQPSSRGQSPTLPAAGDPVAAGMGLTVNVSCNGEQRVSYSPYAETLPSDLPTIGGMSGLSTPHNATPRTESPMTLQSPRALSIDASSQPPPLTVSSSGSPSTLYPQAYPSPLAPPLDTPQQVGIQPVATATPPQPFVLNNEQAMQGGMSMDAMNMYSMSGMAQPTFPALSNPNAMFANMAMQARANAIGNAVLAGQMQHAMVLAMQAQQHMMMHQGRAPQPVQPQQPLPKAKKKKERAGSMGEVCKQKLAQSPPTTVKREERNGKENEKGSEKPKEKKKVKEPEKEKAATNEAPSDAATFDAGSPSPATDKGKRVGHQVPPAFVHSQLLYPSGMTRKQRRAILFGHQDAYSFGCPYGIKVPFEHADGTLTTEEEEAMCTKLGIAYPLPTPPPCRREEAEGAEEAVSPAATEQQAQAS